MTLPLRSIEHIEPPMAVFQGLASHMGVACGCAEELRVPGPHIRKVYVMR